MTSQGIGLRKGPEKIFKIPVHCQARKAAALCKITYYIIPRKINRNRQDHSDLLVVPIRNPKLQTTVARVAKSRRAASYRAYEYRALGEVINDGAMWD